MTATETRSVVIERDLPFPLERVWRAISDPELMAEWLMSTDFQPHIGAEFRFTAAWGEIECRVIDVQPMERLSYTWNAFELCSEVTWSFAPTPMGTHLRMEQSGFLLNQKQEFGGARSGWAAFLDNLETLLSRTA